MIENPYRVGDTVLASREQDGRQHEQGKVVDAYCLIIGEEERPMVVVEFPGGHRAYLQSNGADVLPLPEPAPGEEEPGS